MFNDDAYDYLFKVVVIGDCGVGKTCVVQRFKAGTYVERHGNTIGVDFAMKEVSVDNKRIKLQIWDTAGQERFRTITQSYYRSAHGVLIVYDITKRSSFVSVQRWMDEVRRYTASNVLVMMIGNKCDAEESREVEVTEAEAIAEGYEEVITVLETSAKEDTNVTEAMLTLARKLKDQHGNSSGTGLGLDNDQKGSTFGRSAGGGFRLGGSNLEAKKGTCCSAIV